jgi:hypothetical protein
MAEQERPQAKQERPQAKLQERPQAKLQERPQGKPQARPQSRLEKRLGGRADRDAMIAKQRADFRKRQRNKRIFNYAILIAILLAVAYAVYTYARSDDTQYDALAKCLATRGAAMYGTEWCPHCQEQKREFGLSFRYVHYVNCDLHPDVCAAHNVSGYPTWLFASGPPAEGAQPLALLAERTGCKQ